MVRRNVFTYKRRDPLNNYVLGPIVGQHGFMRVIEATIAFLIILTVLLLISFNGKTHSENEIIELTHQILDEAAQNNSLRESIILNSSNPSAEIQSMFVERTNNDAFDYIVLICEINEICDFKGHSEEVYVTERVISSGRSNLDFNPKKIRIFILRKTL